MTRKGKLPIPRPKGVEVTLSNNELKVKGPKGTLECKLLPGILVDIEPEQLKVSLDENHKSQKNFHGLYYALISNMVKGTSEGFEKKLEMIGVGYRSVVQGHELQLFVGYSHPIKLHIPDGIKVAIEKNTKLTISGIDKHKIGQFAATIRSHRPPEPYQGKGIRYEGEYVRKKAGKAVAAKK